MLQAKFINRIITFYKKRKNCFGDFDNSEICIYCDVLKKCKRFTKLLKEQPIQETPPSMEYAQQARRSVEK